MDVVVRTDGKCEEALINNDVVKVLPHYLSILPNDELQDLDELR